MLDKAYGYSREASSISSDGSSDDGKDSATEENTKRTRVEAHRGFYTVPAAQGKGNSFICFRPEGDTTREWVAAQIQKIYEERGVATFIVRRRKPLSLNAMDGFRRFWSQGYEAKLVSGEYSTHSEVIPKNWIVGHTVHWDLNENVTAVMKSPEVRRCIPSEDKLS